MASIPGEAASQSRALMRLNRSLTNDQLAQILENAAQDASSMAARIGTMSGVGAQTRAAQLRLSSQGSREIAKQLWATADKQIRQGIFDSVDLALNHALDVDSLTGMPLSNILGYAEGLQTSIGQTARAIIQREQFGFTLSDRVWRNQALASGRIHDVIQSGLARQLSARELAKEVRSLVSPHARGGVSYAAMRLARTEINNSYHWAYKDQMSKRPWVNKMQWKLSGSHPETDICDEFAHEGLYTPKEVPDKPHPHCLCYTVPHMADKEEFTDSLLGGEYDDWLQERGMEPLGTLSGLKSQVLEQRKAGVGWPDIALQAKGRGQVTKPLPPSRAYLDMGLDPDAQDAWMARHYSVEQLEDQIPGDALDLLEFYGQEPSTYNNFLRFGEGDDWIQGEIDEMVDAVFSRSFVAEDIKAFRGLSDDAWDAIAQGSEFTEPGFLSTSLDRGVAENFGSYTMEVSIPQGTPGVGMESLTGMGEAEMLLPPNTTLRIVGIDEEAKKVFAEVVTSG